MSLEIKVGPPQLVIHDGQTVFATEPDGQVRFRTAKGLMFYDTRLISGWNIYANGEEWQLLNGAALEHYAARVFLTNPPIPTQEGEIGEHSLSLVIGRWIEGGIHEDLDVTNHGPKHVCFNLEIALRSDFADVFEVKSGRFVRRGRITTEWDDASQTLRTAYVNDDFMRAVSVRASSTTRAVYANGRVSFEIDLAPSQSWHGCLFYELDDGAHRHEAPAACLDHAGESRPALDLAAWHKGALKLETTNEEFYRLYHQAMDDIVSLRMTIVDDGVAHVVPAAGLPWFVALFGRDSLIVSMQLAPVSIEFARGTLPVLGARQAHARDDYRDAEPGKILHEMRHGELAHFKLIPHTPYYGTADATPLWVMLLHSAWLWTGDRALIEQHLPTAERCLEWIDEYGDRDGDGFQEYATNSVAGYENVGWKDSGDGVLYEDGRVVKGPKALCELQGYVYAAWTGMADIYAALGQTDKAATMTARAKKLFDQFNEAFWDEAAGFYAFTLDGDKKRVMSIASNPGHCLWTGIVRPDRAERVVRRMLEPDMFSGWGIRTLSADHLAYNPYSYHNGSVWPHDNGIAALGMKRYGFGEEANRVARAVSGAGGFFSQHQLPELYAGIARGGTNFPVQYLGVNVPQAWAAGSAFAFLRAILGLQPDAPNRALNVDPLLPSWMHEIHLTDLRVGDQSFDLAFRSINGETLMEVLRGDPAAVRIRPRGEPPLLTP
jgi:glycogen debranching enzyme